jgi:hypothetical protein
MRVVPIHWLTKPLEDLRKQGRGVIRTPRRDTERAVRNVTGAERTRASQTDRDATVTERTEPTRDDTNGPKRFREGHVTHQPCTLFA